MGTLALGLVLGVLVGVLAGGGDGPGSTAYLASHRQLARDKAAVDAQEKQLDRRSRTVADAEKRLRARARRLGVIATRMKRNTIASDGIFSVGGDIRPGTYKTSGAPGCYYAILNSPDNFDIASNNSIDGPSVVSLPAGKYFQTEGCADWVLQP